MFLKITINNFSEQETAKTIKIPVDSCQKITKKDKIDYLYAEKKEKKEEEKKNLVLNYFEIIENGKTKILATTGTVELIEIPVAQENILQTWKKP